MLDAGALTIYPRGMAKQGAVQRAERVVGFLMALRNPKIATVLAARGFRVDDLDEGLALIRRTMPPSLEIPSAGQPVDEGPLETLARWSRRWLPIAAIALRRPAPELRAELLDNLPDEVAVAVALFFQRLDALDGSGEKGLARGKKRAAAGESRGATARALMAKRGLTAEVLEEGRQALATAMAIGKMASNQWDESVFEEADNELWAFYLEWSLVARSAIKDKRLLRQLGFRPASGAKEAEDGEETEG